VAAKNRDEAVAPTAYREIFVGAAAWPRYGAKSRDEAVAPTRFDQPLPLQVRSPGRTYNVSPARATMST
jgi:hypothetical protein